MRCGHNRLVPLLLCDLDDTLIDRQLVFASWADDFANGHGADLPGLAGWLIEQDDNGRAPREVFLSAVRRRMGLADNVEALVREWTRAFPHRFEPDRDVRDVLVRARELGWTIVVVTNGGASQRAKTDAADLSDLIDAVVVSGGSVAASPSGRSSSWRRVWARPHWRARGWSVTIQTAICAEPAGWGCALRG